jgi:hypothetical protein
MASGERFKIIVNNYYDEAILTLATGTEAGEMALTNTQVYGNELRFVSTDINEVVITGELNIAKIMGGFSLYRHNLSNTATYRLEIFDDANQTGNLTYDSGIKPSVPQRSFNEWDWRMTPLVSSPFDNWPVRSSYLFFDSIFARSFKLTINDPDNQTGEIEVTRIYMGRTFSPSRNFKWGQTTQPKSNGRQVRTDGGSLYSQVKKKYRAIDFKVTLSDIDRAAFFNATDYLGTDLDFFISLYPNAGNQQEMESAIACKFIEIPSLTDDGYNQNSTSIKIEEC